MPSCNVNAPNDGLCDLGAVCQCSARIRELEHQVAQLQNLVRTDELTKLYNYRFFSETLPIEMERARRSGTSLSLILLDIDFFKQFNDRWGHEAGNQALVHVADVIQRALRRLDFPCRYGGEEFALILPATELTCAITVAERIKDLIANTPFALEQQIVSLTASLGVSSFSPTSGMTPESFITSADTYLYSAKNMGRNQVKYPVIAPSNPQSTLVTDEEKDLLFGPGDEPL